MRNLMKSAVHTSAAVAAMCIGATGAHAIILESDVYGHDANGPLYTIQPFGFSSNTAPVSHAIAMPPGGPFGVLGDPRSLVAGSSHFGAASAAHQTLRSAADLRVSSVPESANASAKTETHFRRESVVGAGTGLAIGAPIRLNLALQLDGAARTGFINHGPPGTGVIIPLDYSLSTSADIRFNYSVLDLDQRVSTGEPGGVAPGNSLPLELASLDSFGRLRYDFQGSSTGDTLWSERRYSWNAFSNVNGVLPGVSVNEYNDGTTGIPVSTGYTLDTGLLALQIDTFVGNTLAIEGTMDIFLQAYAWDGTEGTPSITASSLGDFASTFDAELTSSVAGILLEGELSGVYSPTVPVVTSPIAVPEPEAWTMLLLGLGLIGFNAHRRKASRVKEERHLSPNSSAMALLWRRTSGKALSCCNTLTARAIGMGGGGKPRDLILVRNPLPAKLAWFITRGKLFFAQSRTDRCNEFKTLMLGDI